MGQPVRNQPFLLVLVVSTCLFAIAPVNAEEATLTFPHFATGDGIAAEINLTNPAPQIEKGYILFLDDTGKFLPVNMDGAQGSKVDFSIGPGGSWKRRIAGGEQLQVGYALVFSENAASSLVGNVVFTVNRQFDLSVPDCRPTTSARIYVERHQQANSGYAILNRGDQAIKVLLVVRDSSGSKIGETSLDVGPRQKISGFLDFVHEVPDFLGCLEAHSDSPFYILGLLQRPSGSLVALPAAVSAGPIVGSQLLYFVDTGINMRAGGYSDEALKKTVFELTGLTKATKPVAIKITNNNRNQAVTVHVYFLNDKSRDFLDFLLVLKCGETLTFDPFDFEIPGMPGFKTSNFLFGYGVPDATKFPAAEFGSGRFVLSVLAVGYDSDGNGSADILYPAEAMIGVCGVTPRNTGSEPGISSANLHVFNARPVVFDYLSGNQMYVPAGLDGPSFRADAHLEALSVFTRTVVPVPGQSTGFLADPGNSYLFSYMAERKVPTTGNLVLPSTAVFTWGSQPFMFLEFGR